VEYFFFCFSHLEHRTSVKRFVSLQFLNLTQSVRLLGRGISPSQGRYLKPGVDWARLPREAIFVALPRKVDTMLPRAAERTLPLANLARLEPNRNGSLSRGKGISVCCALSVETDLCLRCLRDSVHQQPRFNAGHEHGKQTNEFAAHKQLRAIDTQPNINKE
jgi:hypothetical protein